jgi:hypothetical protein
MDKTIYPDSRISRLPKFLQPAALFARNLFGNPPPPAAQMSEPSQPSVDPMLPKQTLMDVIEAVPGHVAFLGTPDERLFSKTVAQLPGLVKTAHLVGAGSAPADKTNGVFQYGGDLETGLAKVPSDLRFAAAIVSVGSDQDVEACLEWVSPRVNPGGAILLTGASQSAGRRFWNDHPQFEQTELAEGHALAKRSGATGAATGQPHVPGSWHPDDLKNFTDRVASVPGDFIEIGVWRGSAFSKTLPAAEKQGKTAHAMDSFQGMAPPGEYDWRPEGQFSVGGVEGFKRILLDEHGISSDRYKTWPGFIPDVLATVPAALRFSFALLDVDNYEPTVDALAWLWPRMNVGGIVALDDFYPGGTDTFCNKAINEFLRQANDFEIVSCVNQQLAIKKVAAGPAF